MIKFVFQWKTRILENEQQQGKYLSLPLSELSDEVYWTVESNILYLQISMNQ